MKKLLFTVQVAVFVAALPLFTFLEMNHGNQGHHQPETAVLAMTAAVKAPVVLSPFSTAANRKQIKIKPTHTDRVPCKEIKTIADANEEEMAAINNSFPPAFAFSGADRMNINTNLIEVNDRSDKKLLGELLQQLEKLLNKEVPKLQKINCRCIQKQDTTLISCTSL